MAKKLKLPIQPLYSDGQGVTRFMENGIVRWLIDWSSDRGMSMNDLARMRFGNEERQQFAQLIGYSLSGYSGLPYVTNEAFDEAAKAEVVMLDEESAKKKRTATKARDAKRAVSAVGAKRKNNTLTR
jgi:hypothetical protein